MRERAALGTTSLTLIADPGGAVTRIADMAGGGEMEIGRVTSSARCGGDPMPSRIHPATALALGGRSAGLLARQLATTSSQIGGMGSPLRPNSIRRSFMGGGT